MRNKRRNQMNKLTEAERGNIIAKNVWSWLQNIRDYQPVPWIASPDTSVVIQQKERSRLMNELKLVIEDTVKTMNNEEEPDE